MSAPAVSIILIAYNDAKRLPDAIASAQAQTLRDIEIIVVDDASTDHTAEVVAGFIERDPRIRYHRLEVNSGGCSAPRNAGLDLARGSWVMFGDSDDRLERHAAKNLLIAVEEADAELGCGVAERIVGNRTKRWRSEAHEPGVIASIEDRPRLIYDTICVNKIYRRAWLDEHAIRFPLGLLYEDQVFTMQCYLHANRIAIIDPTVYFWSVDHLSDEPSITQQRHQVGNVVSRVEANRRIDTLLADRPAMRRHKDIKFLAHDLYLYLVSMMTADDALARALADPLIEYLATMEMSGAAELRPALRVAIYHLRIGDLDGMRRAMRAIKWSSVLDAPVVAEGDRALWACEHLADGPTLGGFDARWWLDVTALQPFVASFAQRRYCHQLLSADGNAGAVTLSGRTVDAYLDFPVDLSAALVWQTRAGVVLARMPLTWRVEAGVATWSWSGRVPTPPNTQGLLCLELTGTAGTNTMPIRSSAVPAPFTAGEFGTLTWSGRARRGRVGKVLAFTVGRLMPRSSTLVFAGEGPMELGSGAALAHLIASQRPLVWVQFPSAPPGPHGIPSVPAGSLRHLFLLGRRAAVITDGGPAPYARWVKGPRIGAAELPPLRLRPQDRSPKQVKAVRALLATWTALVAPISTAMHRWQEATGWHGDRYPFHPLFEAARRAPRHPQHVLFTAQGEIPPEWIDAAAALAGRVQAVIVRGDRHHAHLPAELRTWVRDGRGTPSHELLADAQVVVTDGAASTWVAAALGIPIVTWGCTIPVAPRASTVDELVHLIEHAHAAPQAAAWAVEGVGAPVDDVSALIGVGRS